MATRFSPVLSFPVGIIGPYRGVNVTEGHDRVAQVPAEIDGGDHQVRHPRIAPFLAPSEALVKEPVESPEIWC